MKFQIAIDRGGTFTDVWYRTSNNKVDTLKLLSEDPENYKDAPFEAIRRIIEKELGEKQTIGDKIDFKHIDWIRMGTTVATNALLERKGEPCALLITEGFRDLLYIGNQSRPNIFDLKIEMPEMLYSTVIEVEERIILVNDKCKLTDKGTMVVGRNGEKVIVRKCLNENKVRQDLKILLKSGIRSIAVALAHSYIYPNHEEQIGRIAEELMFTQISLSSHIMPMIKLVPRGLTVTADAYLTPCIKKYIDGFKEGFVGLNDQSPILFMQSDGGLAPMNKFMGSRAILSGPAGGVIGYAMTTYNRNTAQPIVGFDMGGTSTDVSRYGGHLEHVFESVTAGISIQCPQLDINTVAAGGGSRLFFRESEGIFSVGPESAGAHPGPICYRKGGYLTVTDANLVLGRIITKYFPKIFGPHENEPLDCDSAFAAMQTVTDEVNRFVLTQYHDDSHRMTVEQVAYGFIQVANETMCRPIRSLTQGKGFDTSKHVLACFGGAGGQHACAIARALGMRKVFIHRFSGILSAFGLALADVVCERQEPFGRFYTVHSYPVICDRLQILSQSCIDELLKSQRFPIDRITTEPFLNLRYRGTDCALMISGGDCRRLVEKYETFIERFIDRYKSEFGFILENRDIVIDDVRVRASGLSGIDCISERGNSGECVGNEVTAEEYVDVYFDGLLRSPVYLLERLPHNIVVRGPGIIIDRNSTVVVEPNCSFVVNDNCDMEIEIETVKKRSEKNATDFDTIQLSIFSHRFMSIAEQMGRVLQRTAISTNIKERLDFSCALFGPDGGLVANAPHIPVHLGAMQETVQYQMRKLMNRFQPGDVLLSNHPQTGGSHLPDLTVITPVFLVGLSSPIFFLANRGHHADIGGSTPGSMPPHSKTIYEEGAVFKTFFLVKDGVFREKEVVEALQYPSRYAGCTGSRNISDNLSDLRAQVAANEKGRLLVSELIGEYGLDVVQSYMGYIQDNAELAVRSMLKEIGKMRFSQSGVNYLEAVDYMDTGSKIQLKVSIDIEEGSALFDFSGSGVQSIGNLNTPRAVTQSCLVYCLRCMVGHDVPLNQGCLKPIKVIIPEDSFLNPSEEAAVVGGNVLTSQRIVDVIFKAFGCCAASQGCMNNVTFGDEDVGYYETVAGGSGAGPSWHGRSGVHSHMTNTRITDLEILESRYPVVLEKFSLKVGTGGKGKFHGGNGIERCLMFRSNMTLSLLTERRVFAPYGLNGGQPGEKGENILVRFANPLRKIDLGAKVSLEMFPGDILRLQTPGGGGFGLEDGDSLEDEEDRKIISTGNGFQLKGSVHDYTMQQFSA